MNVLRNITIAAIGVIGLSTTAGVASADDSSTTYERFTAAYPGVTERACTTPNELNCVNTYANLRRGDGIFFRVYLNEEVQQRSGYVGVTWPPAKVAARPSTTVKWVVQASKHLRPCRYEDSRNCFWDASSRGNGVGNSFIDLNGKVYYFKKGLN